jgi:hypothetical protein
LRVLGGQASRFTGQILRAGSTRGGQAAGAEGGAEQLGNAEVISAGGPADPGGEPLRLHEQPGSFPHVPIDTFQYRAVNMVRQRTGISPEQAQTQRNLCLIDLFQGQKWTKMRRGRYNSGNSESP